MFETFKRLLKLRRIEHLDKALAEMPSRRASLKAEARELQREYDLLKEEMNNLEQLTK